MTTDKELLDLAARAGVQHIGEPHCLISFASAIEQRTLERAAKVCEEASWFDGGKCAAAIREMMEEK